jgi:CDP-diacylglycerol--glycerol-3-phosphate 3-phosphatidyltransferase
MRYTIEEISTPSNMLSMLRLVMAVPLWYLFDYLGDPGMRLVIFSVCVIAALTDILDGYLARKYNQVTEFGKIIDPLADKVAVAAIIIKLFVIGEIPPYYFIMIIARDVLIFLGGILVAQKIGRVLPSNVLGKITVIVIGIVILLIALGIPKDSMIYLIPYGLSIILIFVSFIGYVIRAMEFLKRKKYESV